MMKQVLCILFVLVTGYANSQSLTLPATTIAAITDIQKDLKRNNGTPSQKIMQWYPIEKHAGVFVIPVLAKVNGQFNESNLSSAGIFVGGRIGQIVSMRIPITLLNENMFIQGVDYLEIAEKIEPFLNGALVDTRADSVHMGYNLPQGYSGNNVLIGIADWGFDYTHPVFYDTSLTTNRILAAWDQAKISGPPPVGFSYGTTYTTEAELLAAQSDTFSNASTYHGTHVAGIAGGSGGGTAYKGVGFSANLLFTQMGVTTAGSLDAFAWMYGISQAQGKRLVINNSWGGYRTNPLDGTALLSEAIDAYSDSNVVFVFSAANNGDVNFHLKKTFNAGDSVKTRITGFNYTTDTVLWGQGINMWGEAGKPFGVQLRVLNSSNVLITQSPLFNTQTSAAYTDTFLVAGADTVWYRMTVEDAHPLNGAPQMILDVKCTNPLLRCVMYAEADSGTVHFWNTRLTIFGNGNWGYAFSSMGAGYTPGDKLYGVGFPGVTNSVITVAAHVTNAGIASFSSYGPRIDEVRKPDISAPGYQLISALNSFAAGTFTPVASITFNSNTYEFIRLSGTSMSGPMVAGVVSLILEAAPGMTPEQVKDLIIFSARTDGFTGTIPAAGSNRWGWGKVNAYAAIRNLVFASVEQEGNATGFWTVYPNPANDQLFIAGEKEGTTYILTTLYGQLIRTGNATHSIDISTIADGLYMLTIANGERTQTLRFVITR